MVRSLSVLAAVAAVLMLPGVLAGLGPTDSNLYNYVWTKQFADAFAHGELYPRWLPQSFGGLGSPAFYFYPPLAYVVAGLLALVLPVQTAVAAAGLAFTFGSGVAMHLWLREKSRHALLGAVLYMAAPYHLIDAYVRGALAEAAAFVWLPLIALAIDRINTRRGPALLALAYTGLILTHLPMAVLTSVFLIPPLVVLTGPLHPTRLARAATGIGLGLMLAAPYLLPALTLRGAIHSEILTAEHFDPRHWSPWGVFPWNIGRFRTFLVIALGWSVLAIGAVRDKPGWSALVLTTAACSLALAPQLWALPVLHEVQFPWRLLAVVEFAAVTAISLAPPKPVYLVAAAVLLAATTVTGMDFRGRPLPAGIDRQMTDAVEYLPAGYDPPAPLRTGIDPDLSRLQQRVVAGPIGAVSLRSNGEAALTVTAPGQAIVRRANFPAWRVTGPGGEVAIAPGPLISFAAAQPGRYTVERVLLPTERIGLALSLAGLIGVALTSLRLRLDLRALRPVPAS
jgi:hypothetical protein